MESQSQPQSDPRFNGGGTPVGKLIQAPPPPQAPPQQMPPQQMAQQQMHPQQVMQQQMAQQQQMQRQPLLQQQHSIHNLPNQEKSINSGITEKFESFTNCSWQKFIAIVILVIIFNNSMIYDFEKNIIPVNMRFGDPPLFAVILNAIIVGLIFLIISKFT